MNSARYFPVRRDSARSYVESEASGVRINLCYLKAELDHAVKTNVDAYMSGTPLLSVPTAETNQAMAESECDCFVRGKETCSGTCACRTAMKVCEVTCNCHGFCCNSFATMPKLDMREGALGQELYTRDNLTQQKLAFVVCGQILTESLFEGIAKIDPRRCYYGVRVSWPGYTMDVSGDPGEVRFVVDPWNHISGTVNHSQTCKLMTVCGSCSWANGKVYAVGRTLRRILSKEALTFDYKWTGVINGPAAELCFCRSSRCRGFIADPCSKLMERSIHHYKNELDRLQAFHDDEEKTLQDQIQTMDNETKRILSIPQQLRITRRLDKNDKLKVACDNIEVAVKRATDAMSVARHTKCMERATQYARKLHDLNCKPSKKIPPKSKSPDPPLFSTQARASSCFGLSAQELDEPIEPLPLSLALASTGSLRYTSTKPPWIPSGSRSRQTLHLKEFPPLSLPCSHLPSPRIPRPRHPRTKPLGKLPANITDWPDSGLLSLDERKKLMAWIEGKISARGGSRGVYPPEGAVEFAFWLHTRMRKPDEKKMRTFRRRWSGITTQEMLERFEEESGDGGGMSRRALHCMLADVLTYTPWKWELLEEVKMVEDRGEGDRWPLLWRDLLTLPGVVPEFSADRVCASYRA